MMSQSGRIALVLAALLAIALLVGAMMLREPLRKSKTAQEIHPDNDATVVDVRTPRMSANRASFRRQSDDRRATTTRPREAGVIEMPLHVPQPLPSLSGYIVDQFSDWTAIPEGYRAEGVVLRNGTITLAGDDSSTAPRNGLIVSPPIALRAPSLAGPADTSAILKDGASVQLEISLSEDGAQWSPWIVLNRYRKPEGNRVDPPFQPSLANADLNTTHRQTSATVSGPSIRYRLHLSAGGTASPSVADVRIWKREYQ